MKKKNNKKLLCKENIKIMLYTLLFVFIDQITKFLVVKFITKKTIISGFLYLNYITNSGAAFSILSGNKVFLVLVSTILILYTVNEVANDYSGFNLYGLLLILGGAIGNLIDRLFRGEVVDFISFKIFKYYCPIFNVADIFITIGVIILLYSMLKKDVKNENRSRKRK